MLLPISHEKMRTRRLPLVTLVLVLLNVVVHGIVAGVTPDAEKRVVGAVVEADLLRREQPSLGICQPLEPFGTATVDGDLADKSAALRERADALGDALAGRTGARAESDAVNEERRKKYDAACDALAVAIDALPARRFGYVPAKKNVGALLTSMFLHGSIWHLLGNMWFLFLAGFALEDRWGRLPFLGFYLAAGFVATLVHGLVNAGSTVAVIGASGAVAGAMGTFLVLFTTTRIRFVLVLGRPVFFGAPAYVMLPLWVVVEAMFGLIGKEAGTAHWAHVGGFLFGVLVAVAFRLLGFDRRLDDAVERVAVLGDDPRIDTARALVGAGDAPAALAMLRGLAREKPESIHVWRALFDAATAARDPSAITEATLALEALAEKRAPSPVTPERAHDTPPRSFRVVPKTTSSASVPVAVPRKTPEPEVAPYFPPAPPRK